MTSIDATKLNLGLSAWRLYRQDYRLQLKQVRLLRLVLVPLWAMASLQEVGLGSSAVTRPPSLAILSDKKPAPQPTSNTSMPSRGRRELPLGRLLLRNSMRWQLWWQSIWEGPLGCHQPLRVLNRSISPWLTDPANPNLRTALVSITQIIYKSPAQHQFILRSPILVMQNIRFQWLHVLGLPRLQDRWQRRLLNSLVATGPEQVAYFLGCRNNSHEYRRSLVGSFNPMMSLSSILLTTAFLLMMPQLGLLSMLTFSLLMVVLRCRDLSSLLVVFLRSILGFYLSGYLLELDCQGPKQFFSHSKPGLMLLVLAGYFWLRCTIPLAMFSKLRVNLLMGQRLCVQQGYIIKVRMIKTLNIPEQQLSIPQRLLYVCKKPSPGIDSKPQIDFILLDREMEQLQQTQSKICQQVVEFVDEHLEQFISINQRFESIAGTIDRSQALIKSIIPKIEGYKAKIYHPQSKIQEFITGYDKNLIQQQISQICKGQAQFLLEFVNQFQQLIGLNVEQLTHRHKYFIVRLLKKKQYMRCVFEHPLIQHACKDTNDLINLLDNMFQELEFYLSEQLARVACTPDIRNLSVGGQSIMQEFKIWYQFMGKEENFYEIVEETITGKEISTLESFILGQKQSLITGKNEHSLKQFFTNLFKLISEFPDNYPSDRILNIMYKFLGKKQLNFMYSYVVPTFPLAYSAYKQAIAAISNVEMRKQLEIKHGWNLKFWADLRIKSIMDRSAKETYLNLAKWIEIVFKKSFLLEGVKHYMVKLAFLLANRFAAKLEESSEEYSSSTLNEAYRQLEAVDQIIRIKLTEGFEQEMADSQMQQVLVRQEIQAIRRAIYDTIDEAIRKWIVVTMDTVISTAKTSLEPCKGFVLKATKKDKPKGPINTRETVLRSLSSFLKNNPGITPECGRYVERAILKEIEKHYDSQYVKEIYSYCTSNVSTDQKKTVMELISVERHQLFSPEQSSK